MMVSKEISKALNPFRQRRAELAARPDYIREVLADGARRARVIARETLNEAKQRMGLR
jgi:tryptophanyl-tRNA synthetase